MINSQIFHRIVITEKSNRLLETHQQVVFVVSWKASKTQIKKVFEEIFGYKVSSVNVMRYFGRSRRIGRYAGKTKRFKKAIITLAPGQKFDFLQAKKPTAPVAPTNKPSLVDKTSPTTKPAPSKKGLFRKIQDQLSKLTKIDTDSLTGDDLKTKKKNSDSKK